MQPHYSPEFPLGFNANYRSPAIPFYLSWDEVAEITRTGIIPDADGKKYLMADQKEASPLITYKGDFQNHRSNDKFTGARSPYIAIDIDIDQKLSGLNKYSLTDEQRIKVNSDMEVMLNFMSGDKRDYFFLKKSSSGCGLHLILKLEGVPDGQMPNYEREVINQFNKALKEITGLSYKYAADPAMMKLGQALGLSKDENVIYNPGRVTQASMYNPTQEYGEQTQGEHIEYQRRAPHRFDRLSFIRFSQFCKKEQKRLPYEDINRLSFIFLLLWPEASAAEYVEICSGLNEARAKEQGENSMKFLMNEYKKVKKAASKPYHGDPIGINSLYYIRQKYGYVFKPDKELRFTGYLQNIEPEIREIFHAHNYIVLESPTGSRRAVLIKDNKSKALLHKALVPNGESDYIRDLLKATFEKYNLLNTTQTVNIISDGGPENKGKVLEWVSGLKNDKVLKLTAQENFNHSNNMIESLFHIFKYEFLRDRKIHDDAGLLKELNAFEDYYNWHRFPIELYGYAPMEVVHGAIPDRNRFKEDIKKAQQKRYLLNKASTYCGICE